MKTEIKFYFTIRVKTRNGTHEENCNSLEYAKFRASQEEKLNHQVTIYRVTQEFKAIEL